MKKVKGYKILGIRISGDKVLCDVALFGEKSLVVDNIQVCESIEENITYERKQEIEKEYGKELAHNFLNDTLIIF